MVAKAENYIVINPPAEAGLLFLDWQSIMRFALGFRKGAKAPIINSIRTPA